MLDTRSGVRMGTIFGFPIVIDGTLVLLLAVLVLWELQEGLLAFGQSMLFYGVILASVIVHEVGHAVAIRRLNLGESIIILSGLGGITKYQGTPNSRQGVLVALAGPGLGMALGGIALPFWLTASAWAPPTAEHVFFLLVMVNLGFNLANLLPVYPLDGGQVLRFLLLDRLPRAKALQITAIVGTMILTAAGVTLYVYSGFSSIFVWLIIAIIASENMRLWQYARQNR